MNEHLVSIKVDREERPDVDAVYMTATQAMTGQGGWPMTVFMTPDREPFFCGTYFPREQFQRLVLRAADAWRQDRGSVTGQAKRIAAALAEQMSAAGLRRGRRARRRRRARVATLASRGGRCPGWSRATTRSAAGSAGRPSSRRRWCWSSCSGTTSGTGEQSGARGAAHGHAHPGARWPAAACTTSSRGGFARYSVDADWVVPHFEKMLYDNALLARVYAHWWRRTGSAAGPPRRRRTPAPG